MLGKIDVPGLGSVEIKDIESFDVGKSFMEYIYKKLNGNDVKELFELPKCETEERTIEDIKNELHGVKEEVPASKPREKTIWSEEETQYLIDNHGNMSAASIAKHLGRTINGVKCRGYKHGFKFRAKRRKGVKRGAYKKPEEPKEPEEYLSVKKRILDSPRTLIIKDFLKANPDIKEDTLTTVLSRLIEKGHARQDRPGVIVHG